MKNLKLFSILAFLLLGGISLSAQEFGIVNLDEVLNSYPAKISADQELENMVKAHQTKLKEKQDALQAIENAVKSKTDGKSQAEIQAMLPELEKQQQEYVTKQQDLVNYQQAAAKEVGEREDALMGPIEATVRNSIKRVADQKGIKYVMEKNSLLYSNGVDITADVKKDLGIK